MTVTVQLVDTRRDLSRWLAGAWRTVQFPVVAYVVWRVAHLAVFVASAGWPNHQRFFWWDAGWYWGIMVDGYESIDHVQQPTAFFPLLPWLGRGIRLLIRNDLATGLFVSTVASLAAVCLVFFAVREWRSEGTAQWTVALLLAYPGSVFLWLFYSEALFIALTAGAVLAYRRDRIVVSGVLSTAAAMTRPPGILVAVLLAVAAWRRYGARRTLPYALALAGVAAVALAQHFEAGDAMAWARSGEAWGREATFPLIPLADSIYAHLQGWVPLEGWSRTSIFYDGSPFDLVAAVLFLFLGGLAARHRWPRTAQALIIAFTLVPLATGLVLGMGRYVLAAWPAFGVLGETRARIPAAVTFAAFSVLFVHDRAVGLFVG